MLESSRRCLWCDSKNCWADCFCSEVFDMVDPLSTWRIGYQVMVKIYSWMIYLDNVCTVFTYIIYIYITVYIERILRSKAVFLQAFSKMAKQVSVFVTFPGLFRVHRLVWNAAIQKEIHTTTWRIGRKQKQPSPACRHDFSRRDFSRDSPFGSRVMLGVVRLVIFPQGIQIE